MSDFDLNVDFDSIESLDDLILYEDLIAFRLNQSRYLNCSHVVIWISNNYYAINILGHDKLVNTNQSIMKIGSYYIYDIRYKLSVRADNKDYIINLFQQNSVVSYTKLLNDVNAYYQTYLVYKDPEKYKVYINKEYYMRSIFEIHKHRIDYSLYEHNFELKLYNNYIYITDLNTKLSIRLNEYNAQNKLITLDKREYIVCKELFTKIVINFIDKINNVENLSIKDKIKVMPYNLNFIKTIPTYCSINLDDYFVYRALV